MKNEDFEIAKRIALSTMETAENLMDECTKRANRIKELESTIHALEAYHDMVRDVHQIREREFATVCERYKIDLELLDDILKIVNPLIKSGAYAKPAAESRLLATRMHGLCQEVVQFRRKHDIGG